MGSECDVKYNDGGLAWKEGNHFVTQKALHGYDITHCVTSLSVNLKIQLVSH